MEIVNFGKQGFAHRFVPGLGRQYYKSTGVGTRVQAERLAHYPGAFMDA